MQKGQPLQELATDNTHQYSLYYSMVKSRTNYLLRINQEGDVTLVNRAFEQKFGSKEEFLGKPFQNVLHSGDQGIYHQVVDQCLQNPGEPVSVELRKVKEGKSFYTICWEFVAIAQDDGKIIEIQGLGYDITDEKETEQQLQQVNELNQHLITISAQFINIDRQSLRPTINEALATITQFLGFQRGLIYLRRGSSLSGSLAYEYSQAENLIVADIARIISLKNLPWWKDTILRCETIEIPDSSALPKDAFQEKFLLSSLEIQALIAVPIVYQQKLNGYIVFTHSSKAKHWSTKLLEPLKLLGTILGTALHHIRLNQELSESRLRYKLLADNIADMVSKHDLDGTYNYVSPSCEALTGYTQDELLGTSSMRNMHPDDLARAQEHLSDILKGKTTQYQYRKRRKDGQYRWMEITAKLITENGNQEIIASTRDIHHRKLTEEANAALLYKSQQLNERLQASQQELETTLTRTQELNEMLLKSEKKFRSLTEKSFDAIMMYNAEGMITYASPSVANVMGYSAEELVGTYARDYIFPEDLPMVREILMKSMKLPHQRMKSLSRLVRKDGEIIWVESVMTNLLMDESIQGLVSNFRDVTEQRRSEEAIQEYSERLAIATQSANIGIWDWHIPDNKLIWDERVKDMYGISSEQSVNNTELWHQIIHPDDHDAEVERVRGALENERDYDTEYRIIRLDTQEVHHIKVYAKITREKGKPIRMTGVNLDITNIKNTEQQLRENNEALRKSNAELDQFVYSTSHNLRSPLASVLGLVSVLQGTEDPEERTQYLRLIESSIHRLDETIHEIIEYSRNTRTDIRKAPIHFREIIADILDGLYFLRNSIDIDVRLDIPDDLGFVSDPVRMRTIFNNLLSNAIKYYNPWVEHPFVSITIEKKKRGVKITVADNGLGIDKASQDRIFDMFYRATTNASGSGLGLYIVQESVHKLGGTISLISEKGEGSTFILEFPSLA